MHTLIQEAFATVPPDLNPGKPLTVENLGNGSNIVCKFWAHGHPYLLKIFRPSKHPSPLMPTPGESADKEAWLAEIPDLKPFIPSIRHKGTIIRDGETLSYFVQDYADLTTAAAGVHTPKDAVELAISLGKFCNRLHAVKAKGFGSILHQNQGRFSVETWSDYISRRLRLSGIELLAKERSDLESITKELYNRILSIPSTDQPTLFHHDLLHNWSNVLLVQGKVRLNSVIDWSQCGSGNAIVVELGVARFALRNRVESGFGWKEFLTYFLEGYGTGIETYRAALLNSVNSFSTLYALRSAQLFPQRKAEYLTYVLDALRSDTE